MLCLDDAGDVFKFSAVEDIDVVAFLNIDISCIWKVRLEVSLSE